jgi:hypothetical protein
MAAIELAAVASAAVVLKGDDRYNIDARDSTRAGASTIRSGGLLNTAQMGARANRSTRLGGDSWRQR